MISVCVATYNGAKYIQEQLESILSQLSTEDEVIVSDGGSSDNTAECVLQIKDRRIRWITLPPQATNERGIWKQVTLIRRNFENALRQARGEIIFLSDQDDKWLPGKVDKVLSVMKSNTMCVVHDAKVTDDKLSIVHPSIMNLFKPVFYRWGVLIKSPYMGCCMAIRRSVVEKALPIPNGVEYDTWLGCVARKMGEVQFIKEPLLLYRRHKNNASYLAYKNKNSIAVKIKRRYNIIKSCVLYL